MEYHFFCGENKDLKSLKNQIIKQVVNYHSLPYFLKIRYSTTPPEKCNIPWINWLKYQPNGKVEINYHNKPTNQSITELLPKKDERLKDGLIRILKITQQN